MARRYALIALVALSATAADVPAQQSGSGRTGVDAFRAVGSIVDVSGSSDQRTIQRKGATTTIAAARGEFLYPGDVVRVRGQNVAAHILIQGWSTSRVITERNSPYRVTATAKAPPGGLMRFLSLIRWPFSSRDPITRKATYIKGDGEGPMVAQPILPVSRAPTLPVREMVIPDDLDHLTVTWCGDASYGKVYRAGSIAGEFDDEGGVGRLTGLVRNGADEIRVFNRQDADFLKFEIRRVPRNHIPRPSWLGNANPHGAMERTAWGAWLLTEGPPEYRAYGLTLLDDSKFELAAAAQYFGAAVTCPA